MLLHLNASGFGQRVQRCDLIERRFVKRAPDQPALPAITVEIALPQVFNPDETLGWIVEIDLRHADSMLAEKIRDGDVMPIFFPLEVVFD